MRIKKNYTFRSEKYFFGTRKEDKARTYLEMPKIDCACDWRWSLGHLINRYEIYYLDRYQKGRSICMVEALKEDYDLNPKIKDNLWLFCELFQTAYTIREYSDVIFRGDSHYTKNPLHDLIVSSSEYERINENLLPAIFEKIENILRH